MQRMGDMTELIEKLRQRGTSAPSTSNDKEIKENGRTYKILNYRSDKCPYGLCNGDGHLLLFDQEEKDYQDEDRKRRKEQGISPTIYDRMYEFQRDCKCRPSVVMKSRGRVAGIPEQFRDLTLNSFDTSLYEEGENRNMAIRAKRIAGNYVFKFDEIRTMEVNGLYLYSKTKGSGKTRLAASTANAIIKTFMDAGKTIDVRYIVVMDLLDQIKDTFGGKGNRKTSDITKPIKDADLLILDDIGVESPTRFAATTLFGILNHRMTKKLPTIFTSNIPVEQLAMKYTHIDGEEESSDTGERIESRINSMVFQIKLPEEKIRDQVADAKKEDLSALLLDGVNF